MAPDTAPLEQLYPARCYDCGRPSGSIDKVLCPTCEAAYAREKERRRGLR